jgi:hypothetical protein
MLYKAPATSSDRPYKDIIIIFYEEALALEGFLGPLKDY